MKHDEGHFGAPKRHESMEPTASPDVSQDRWHTRCTIPIYTPLSSSYGHGLVLSVGMVSFFIKGAATNLVSQSRQPMLMRRLGLSGTRYQRLSSLYQMGWSLKCFIAPVSDLIAIGGYRKRWYMLSLTVISAAFSLGFALSPTRASFGSAAGAFLFLTCFGMSSVDILCQGLFSRAMRDTPAAGPALVGWVWWLIMAGSFISLMQGPVSDAGVPQAGLFVAAAMQLVVALPCGLNWFHERRNRVERCEDVYRLNDIASTLTDSAAQPKTCEPAGDGDDAVCTSSALAFPESTAIVADDEAEARAATSRDVRLVCGGFFEVNESLFRHYWRYVVLCTVMALSVLTLVLVNILGSKWALLYTCIAVTVVTVGTALWTLPLTMSKMMVMVYFSKLLYIGIPGALDSFYLADETCVPGGPHFSYTFYITVTSVVTYVASMIGAMLFPAVFSQCRFQVIFAITSLLQVAASLFDLIMVERWNLYIGIPDHALFICGDAFIVELVDILSTMPVQVLMSRLCPRGSECMAYAVAAGFNKIGSSLANVIGSLLMEFAWPVRTKVPCDFHNVRYLIIVGHMCLPVVIIPLSVVLLPRNRLSENVEMPKSETEKRQ